MTVGSHKPARLLAVMALVLAAGAVALILRSGDDYRIRVQFTNAGQLVEGGLARVAGREIGKIDRIDLTANGLAQVTLAIDDDAHVPLHAGTRATIRAVGQAGVANRFVELSPGPRTARALADGDVLPPSQTAGIVNLDALLNSFGSAERANLKRLIASGDQLYAGSGARSFNRLLRKLDPATRQLARFTRELVSDRGAIGQLVDTSATVTRAIASRRRDLMAAVGNTATALEAVSRRRRPLASAIDRAPAVLDQTRGTLANAGVALNALRPVLREIPPTAPALRGFLTGLDSTLTQATPVVAQLRGQLPALERSLNGLAPLARPTSKALRSAGEALRDAKPIARVARLYGADLILGVFAGLAGVATANYDRHGHYARLEFTQPYQTTLGGPLSGLLAKPLLPSLFNLRTGLTRRCPGGNTPPAPDGSNPWLLDPSICSASHNAYPSVNTP